MQASDQSGINTYFNKSILAWRATYLARKAATQQVMGAEPPAEKAQAAPLKIRRSHRSKSRL
jgi:hypothetical protein